VSKHLHLLNQVLRRKSHIVFLQPEAAHFLLKVPPVNELPDNGDGELRADIGTANNETKLLMESLQLSLKKALGEERYPHLPICLPTCRFSLYLSV
jgi:hypothetical protein